MKNLIISVMLVMGLVACEVSRPGVKNVGRFSPPDNWVMTPEAEALITPAGDGSRYTELSWSEWGKLKSIGVAIEDNANHAFPYWEMTE